MAQVPIRQPRFLGEKVPYRDQSVQERIQEELGSSYTVESSNGGYVAKAKPVKYLKVKDIRTKKVRAGTTHTYSSYSPHEMTISSEGQVLKEIKRGTYKIDASGKIREWGVYDSEVTDYEKQTRFTFGKRDMKSGRDTIRQTSSYEQGRYKEKRIINQDSKEYEQKKAEHELFSTFVGQGRSYAESRKLSRMTEAQREAHFKQVAKARSQKFSAEGKAITLQHQKQREFEQEYKASAQKYATDIVGKQEAQRTPVVESPKPVQKESTFIVAPTPASPTTRTDMGTPFVMPSKPAPNVISASKPFDPDVKRVTSQEQFSREEQLKADNVVQRQIDKLSFGYQDTAKQFDFHPILSDVAVPFAVGTTTMVLGVAAHPIRAAESMAGMVIQPVKAVKEMQTHFGAISVAKGDVYATSYVAGQFTGGYLVGRAGGKAVEFAKDVYVKAGSKYVEPETVFSGEVLTKGKTFPTTTSTAEALSRFNKGGKSYDVKVAQEIIKSPESFAKPTPKSPVKISDPVVADIQTALGKDVVYTGGIARKIQTGTGRIRDVDIVVESAAQGKADAFAVAKRFPEKYEIIQHEKYPEIYRLRSKQTGKPVADFDPVYLAEEGLINPKSVKRVGEYKVVSSETLLQSKATQIVKGKVNPKYPTKLAENIQQFSPGTPILKDQVIVSTVSPAKLKGKTVTGKVEKVGLEDPGIFVTPKGEASPYFTGIQAGETAYSLNPFKGVLGVPTVTEFAIKGVTTYPKSVVMRPGFAHLGEFQKAQAGKGVAYITKRSQVGTGDVPRQRFELLEETTMSGETVKAGPRIEKGTSEIEAVIGVGEKFEYTPKTTLGKFKGFDLYTKYKGRAIAVRETKVLTGDVAPSVVSDSIIFKAEKVKAGQEMFESVIVESKTVTPTRGVSYGGIKPAEISSSKVAYSKPPTVAKPQILSAESYKSFPSSKIAVSSGVSQLSSGKSVGYSVKTPASSVKFSEVSRPVGSSSLVTGSSSIGLSSGRSFGGSSTPGYSGGGSSTGGGSSGGSGGRPSEGVPPDYPKYTTSRRAEPEKKREQSFKVQVREKGIFKTIAVTETPQEAFRIGKTKIEHTALASLRVKPVGSSEKVTGVGKSILPQQKFRLSTKEPDVFIQKRRFRISTPGEKKEIPYKGLQVQKARRIFGKLGRR